jgi:hypothetical protein
LEWVLRLKNSIILSTMCKEFGSFREDIAVVHASVAL